MMTPKRTRSTPSPFPSPSRNAGGRDGGGHRRGGLDRLLLVLYGSALTMAVVQFAALERGVRGLSSATRLYGDAIFSALANSADGDDDAGGVRGCVHGIAAMPPVDDDGAGVGPTTVLVTSSFDDNGTVISCECDIAGSTDCLLASLPCVPRTLGAVRRSTARGVAIRSAMRETLTFTNKLLERPGVGLHKIGYGLVPIGKGTQYTAIDAWDRYTRRLPLGKMYYTVRSIFVNATAYDYCVERDLRGKDCFFHPIWEGEEGDRAEDPMEKDAVEHVGAQASEGVGRALETYRNSSRSIPEEAEAGGSRHPLALDHLLVFAHLLRMHFNLRQHILDAYHRYLVVVPAAVDSISGRARKDDDSDQKHAKDESSDETIMPLRVGLHVRRADSCEHEKETDGAGADGRHRYLDKASDVHSAAQVTGKRFCYDTAVYMDALRKIQQSMHEMDSAAGAGGTSVGDARHRPPMEVYLSTDYAGQLLEDVKTNFPDLHASCTWKYLEFPREAFVYDSAIEMSHNEDKQGSLGEYAVEDLWHLGHAQVFVGHMGSRFGKVGWLLATARHNTFVPYFTPDGKPYCCEIDENCGESIPLINSMEHCLLFAHELVSAVEEGVPEDIETYWEIGSSVRRRFAERKKKTLKKYIDTRVEMEKSLAKLTEDISELRSWVGR